MTKILAFTNNKGGFDKPLLYSNSTNIFAYNGPNFFDEDSSLQTNSLALFGGAANQLNELEAEIGYLKKRPDKHIKELVFESNKSLDIVAAQVSIFSNLCPITNSDSADIRTTFEPGMIDMECKSNSPGGERIQSFVNCEVLQ
jgi:cellulose biosynthesis protein BcsQ